MLILYAEKQLQGLKSEFFLYLKGSCRSCIYGTYDERNWLNMDVKKVLLGLTISLLLGSGVTVAPYC